ncbi:PRA1 family protein 3 [Colletes gigas]|uniref:PRA1 family protein 3 n=1 Tax=Colletes gigas TaxID=935657 RepID=UPI001C9BB89E|nr:PRA1 family protein 3 [Colletes gigas]
MDKTKATNKDWELPPLRSLNDFLLEPSRFQLPNFKDFEKWGNRVVNNLIYYQTNYLYMTITIILLVGSINLSKMLLGLLAMVVIWGQCLLVYSENHGILYEIKKQYPLLQVILLVLCLCFVFYTLSSILLLLFSLLLSISVIFIHSSLRTRNLKNKLANTIEGIGLERTPMGVFLKYFENTTGYALRTHTT